MADNKMEKSIKEAIGKSLNEFNKRIGMAKLIKDNKNQDRILKGILSQVNDENIEKTEKSNVITLDNSTDGIVELQEIKGDTNVNVSKIEKETPITHVIDDKNGNVISLDGITEGAINIDDIQGNTMVNCNKDTDKELILMPNLETNGYSNITLTEGIDGGKVDVALEGNTMVNVCDQEEPVAITKSYIVDTGNHIALQGEYDGKCRPNIYGNTLVNLVTDITNDSHFLDNGDNTYTYDYASQGGVGAYRYCTFSLSQGFKNATTYTLISYITQNTLVRDENLVNEFNINFPNGYTVGVTKKIPANSIGLVCTTFVTNKDVASGWGNDRIEIVLNKGISKGSITITKPILLEGDYTNKPIPDYFTGMKSSFEDKLVPENLAEFKQFSGFENCASIENGIITITNPATNGAVEYNIKGVKPNTTYTFYFNVLEHTEGVYFNFDLYPDNYKELGSFDNVGENYIVYTMPNDISTLESFRIYIPSGNTTTTKITEPIIVEGDYTNYDFTDYDSTKGGKYKVDYKVTGKNKFDKDSSIINTVINIDNGSIITENKTEGQWYTSPTIDISNISNITISHKNDDYINAGTGIRYLLMDENYNPKLYNDCKYINYTQTLDVSKYKYMKISVLTKLFPLNTIQLEEGTTATDYEPYKESIKTLYLNSPLLEGDTIEQSGNNIIHNHRYGQTLIDGLKDCVLGTTKDGNTYVSKNVPNVAYTKTSNKPIMDKFNLPVSNPYSNPASKGIFGISNGESGFIRIRLEDNKDTTLEQLQQNPITVVYELATPTQEIISTNDNLLLDSYTNGHLDVDSVVPIDKVVFKTLSIPLKYVCANTDYTIQFESDNVGKLYSLYMNGALLSNIDVVKGLNKITCTTLDKGYRTLDVDGIGFNASKIVVTPKVDNDFGYFKGMKSVGECEGNKIEILSQNKNLYVDCFEFGDIQKSSGLNSPSASVYRTKDYIKVEPNTKYSFSRKFTSKWHVLFFYDINKKFIGYNDTFGTKFVTPNNVYYVRYKFLFTDSSGDYIMQIEKGESITNYIEGKMNKKEILLNEPLRGLPNGVKDKYVIIDGKWYIERNCNSATFDGNIQLCGDVSTYFPSDNSSLFYIVKKDAKQTKLICDKFRANIDVADVDRTAEGVFVSINDTSSAFYFRILNSKLSTQDTNGFKQWLQNNPITVVYQLQSPTYEPIDYNPFEVYTDITHISNNSTIPCNMVIRNSGYNCILKPNTTYTVSSSNGLSTVTTKDSIGDSVLRFYDKDTTSITKMNKVLVLEGDYITGNPPIPAFFKGMESAFEQELVTDENDEHYGKYKVEILANNENLFDIKNISYKNTTDYKLENNKIIINSSKQYQGLYYYIPVKRGSRYTICCKNITGGGILLYNGKITGHKVENFLSGMGKNADPKKISVVADEDYITVRVSSEVNVDMDCIFEDILFYKGIEELDYVPHKQNKIQFFLDEPLRGVGDIKDKVYVKENKVVVERNCASVTFDGSNDEDWRYWKNSFLQKVRTIDFYVIYNNKKQGTNVLCNNFTSSSSSYMYDIQGVSGLGGSGLNIWVSIDKIKLQTQDVAGFRKYLQNNPTTVVYQLATPVYEEVEYSNNRLTLNTYNNSTLFYNSNIPISNTSFKPLWEELIYIKNSTTYYIQFNAVGNGNVVVNLGGTELTTAITEGYNKIEITTPNNSTNLLTIDGQGIKISKVVVSEALCSGYYKGLQSCFEEHMENGKYVCVIRGISLDGNKVNGIKFYLNEPLRGIGDIKDRLCIKDGKLMVERNYSSVIFDGSEDEYINPIYGSIYNKKCLYNVKLSTPGTEGVNLISNTLNTSMGSTEYYSEGIYLLNNNNIRFIIDSNKLNNVYTINKFRQWLQNNPTTIVYQLATPVYEEVTNEYGLPIILEGYENGIVYVDSSVTPTTSIKYTSNNKVPAILSNVDNLNTTTQNDINNNIVTYMMDIDMMLTEMEMDDNASVMSLSDSDDNNQNHDSSHSNILDRMNKEDRIKYQDNTTKMLEKVIKGKSLTKEENINRIDLYLSEGKIRKEQSNYLKELLKGVENS